MTSARRLLALVVAALALGGLAACGSDSGDGASAAPKVSLPLSANQLSAHANEILDASPAQFEDQIAALRGRPVVVNQWASWCGPCRFEFPFLAAAAKKYAGRVAFLGVDAKDSRGDAEKFLEEKPVPYPSFYDEDTKIARTFKGGRAWPTTAFYDAEGELVETHAGTYASQAKLEEDIRTHALG